MVWEILVVLYFVFVFHFLGQIVPSYRDFVRGCFRRLYLNATVNDETKACTTCKFIKYDIGFLNMLLRRNDQNFALCMHDQSAYIDNATDLTTGITKEVKKLHYCSTMVNGFSSNTCEGFNLYERAHMNDKLDVTHKWGFDIGNKV